MNFSSYFLEIDLDELNIATKYFLEDDLYRSAKPKRGFSRAIVEF
jgi:hypothetical protein